MAYKCKHIAVANEGEVNETHVVQFVSDTDTADRITVTDPKGVFITGLAFGKAYALVEVTDTPQS